MPCHMLVTVVFLATCALAASNPGNVDCRKFVFAPLCRGVAAKRSYISNAQIQHGIVLDASSLNELLRNFNAITESPIPDDKEEVLSLKKATHEEQTDNGTFKKDKLHPDHLLYTLFLGNKRRSNNEVDNIPLYEYESL